MKKTLTYCFGSLLCLMTLASCQNGGSCCGQAATDVDLTGRLYPKVKTPTKSLVIVDLQNDDIEGQVAAIGLQGIVNRDSEQKIYVMNSRCKDNHGGWKTGPHDMAQMGQFWLDRVLKDIPQETLTLDATKSNPGFSALVEQYKKHIKGVVIYDPELVEATIEAATTIAAQTDALIVSPRLYEEVKGYDFPVIRDLRGMFKTNIECVDWLVENYFETANRDVAFTWSHMTTDFQESWGAANKDYVVANRLFTYFLDIQDHDQCAYYENIVKKYPAGTQIMGWTDELKADKLFAEYGYFMVPFISVENMTVMSSFPSVQGTPIEPKALKAEPNTVYIAMLVSDGDNLLHTMIYMPYTIEESAAYGDVPVDHQPRHRRPRAACFHLVRAGDERRRSGDGRHDGRRLPDDRPLQRFLVLLLADAALPQAGRYAHPQADGRRRSRGLERTALLPRRRLCGHRLARHRFRRIPHGQRLFPYRYDQFASRIPEQGAGQRPGRRTAVPVGHDRHGERGCDHLCVRAQKADRGPQRRPEIRVPEDCRPGRYVPRL